MLPLPVALRSILNRPLSIALAALSFIFPVLAAGGPREDLLTRKVPAWEWTHKDVRTKANCPACHSGAERGYFDDD